MRNLAETQVRPTEVAMEPAVIKNLDPRGEEDIIQTAALYAEVFAGPPWNEYTVCGSCEKFQGQETLVGDGCPHCEGTLQEAYPLQAQTETIRKEISKDNAAAFILREEDGKIKAFAWGFSYDSAETFANTKYHDATMQSDMQSLLQDKGITGPFFYLSEVGIHPDYRNNGLANTLSELLVQEAKAKDMSLVMRTNVKSPMVAVAKRFGMSQIMGPEVYTFNNAVGTTGKIIGFQDRENEDRVLFSLH